MALPIPLLAPVMTATWPSSGDIESPRYYCSHLIVPGEKHIFEWDLTNVTEKFPPSESVPRTFRPTRECIAAAPGFHLSVPGKNQYIVGPGLSNFSRRKNWNVRTGKKLSVFVRIAVDGIVQEVGPNAAVVQQRIAFTGSPVADNRCRRSFAPIRKARISPFVPLYFLAETEIRLQAVEAGSFLSPR